MENPKQKTESSSGDSTNLTKPPSGDGRVKQGAARSPPKSSTAQPSTSNSGLSKSQKRKHRKRLQQQAAADGSQNPQASVTGESAGGKKRPLSDLSTPSPVQQHKRPRDNVPKPSYALAVNAVKVAIVREGFPSL